MFYCTCSPVHCLEYNTNTITESAQLEPIEDITTGELIGYLYDGGYESISTTIKYPKFKIYIMRAGEEINLNSANLKLARFEYDLTTQTKGERKTDITHNSNNNYFILDIVNDPSQYYLMLREWDEETNTETLHEFKIKILGTKAPGEDTEITLYLEVEDDQAGGGNEETNGLIGTIIEILQGIWDFFTGYLEYLGQGIEYALIPSEDFMTNWIDEMQTKVEDSIPILNLPLKILKSFYTDNEAFFTDAPTAYLKWEGIEWEGYEVFPGGEFNFKEDLIDQHLAFQTARNYFIMFSNFGLYLGFANYLRKKFVIIFGKD